MRPLCRKAFGFICLPTSLTERFISTLPTILREEVVNIVKDCMRAFQKNMALACWSGTRNIQRPLKPSRGKRSIRNGEGIGKWILLRHLIPFGAIYTKTCKNNRPITASFRTFFFSSALAGERKMIRNPMWFLASMPKKNKWDSASRLSLTDWKNGIVIIAPVYSVSDRLVRNDGSFYVRGAV